MDRSQELKSVGSEQEGVSPALESLRFSPGDIFDILIEYEGQTFTPEIAGALAVRLTTLVEKKVYDQAVLMGGAFTEAVYQPNADIVGVGEAAEILGITKQRVHQLSRAGKMPKPIANLKATPIWTGEAVRMYSELRSTKPGPSSSS